MFWNVGEVKSIRKLEAWTKKMMNNNLVRTRWDSRALFEVMFEPRWKEPKKKKKEVLGRMGINTAQVMSMRFNGL